MTRPKNAEVPKDLSPQQLLDARLASTRPVKPVRELVRDFSLIVGVVAIVAAEAGVITWGWGIGALLVAGALATVLPHRRFLGNRFSSRRPRRMRCLNAGS
ncbi:MAG: hypothetical protein R3E01_05485 [Pirellulaceae bacterium]|nr:hypothetical protein [Planctomycetales bacterium]